MFVKLLGDHLHLVHVVLAHIEPLDEVVFLHEAVCVGGVQIGASQHVRIDRLGPSELYRGANWVHARCLVDLARVYLRDNIGCLI